jgi:hypothetical protein
MKHLAVAIAFLPRLKKNATFLRSFSAQGAKMSVSILAYQTAGWETWWIGLTALISVAVGLFLGRYLSLRGTAPADTEPAEQDRPHDEAYWAEKRSSPRFQVRAMRVLLAESPNQTDFIEAVMLNRSLGGLGLSVDREIPAGKTLHVCICESERDNHWSVIEIRYCRPERGRWTLGCKFLETPATSANS